MTAIMIIDDAFETQELAAFAPFGLEAEFCFAYTVPEAVAQNEREQFDLVVLGLKKQCSKAPVEDIQSLRRRYPGARLIVLGNELQDNLFAGKARQKVEDYICRPLDEKSVHDLVERHIKGFKGFIGSSRPMQEVFELIKRVAKSNINVMITGESGTGKEVAARAIHQCSSRAEKPFVAINCAAIPQELLESELFGHVKGAFTGAFNERRGLFMEADGGTILLDEIGDMPLALQAKLLRLLQTREIRPIGQNESQKVDVRVIAATHKDLKSLARTGRFREDLFYRLNVIPLHMPPLRERGEDIRLLAEYFLRSKLSEFDCGKKVFAEETIQFLMRAPWTGNVRELENVVLRAITMSTGEKILPKDILLETDGIGIENFVREEEAMITLEDLEKKYIQYVLSRTTNKNEAAAVLGIDRKTLYNKEKQFGFGHVQRAKSRTETEKVATPSSVSPTKANSEGDAKPSLAEVIPLSTTFPR